MNNHPATPNGGRARNTNTRGAARRRARKAPASSASTRARARPAGSASRLPARGYRKIDFFFHRHAVIANAGECPAASNA